MSVQEGNIIRYSDLIDGFDSRLLQLAKNVGGTYASDVPAELRYPYSLVTRIPVESGFTPSVTWNNSADLAIVPVSTFQQSFYGFCDRNLLNNNVYKNSPISEGSVEKFLTAMFCYISCKFVVVYSPLTTKTSIFYFPNNPINESLIVDINPFINSLSNINTLVTSLCNAALVNTKSYVATSSYSLTRR